MFRGGALVALMSLVWMHPSRASEDLVGLTYKLADGTEKTFDELVDGGDLLLLVNTATECGFTEIAFEEMQALHERYPELRVVAVPSNSFNQEPFTNAEIHKVCKARYNSTFPFLSRLEVNGRNTHPMFDVLKRKAHDPCQNADQQCETWAREGECDNNPDYMLETCQLSCGECEVGEGGFLDEPGHVQWNFEKWLVAPTGEVLGRFSFTTSPMALEDIIANFLGFDEEGFEDEDVYEGNGEEGEDEDL